VELSTERLILRPYTVADYDESAAVWGDAEVVRYMGQPATREMSWYRTLRYVGHWSAFGYGMFAVRDRAGRFMGDVGISDFHRDIAPPITAPEAGWVLATWAHGQGYASEALAAALRWFEEAHGAQELACIIDPPNAPSLRVAAKHGFVESRRASYHDAEVIVFTRPRTPGRASRATT
jgi:RimJ/RimL family protein N-acetyltransferase